MSPRPPDQALRRMVAELAATTPDDVAAILAELDLPQRRRVEALLADYLGEPAEAAPAPPPPSVHKAAGLSPWLAARIEGAPDETIRMTPAARDALRACAAGLEPEAPPQAPAPVAREPGLLERAGRILLRRETAP